MANFSRFDWTGSDYDSALADLIARVQSLWPEWTNTGNPADPGVVLLELLPYVVDLIRYYQDRQINEAIPITALDRANVIRHLRWIGYVLATAAPATTSLTFTLAKVQTDSVVIAQGDQVTTPDGSVVGEVVAQLAIPAGSTSGTVDWIQGTTVAEDPGISDGSASQRFSLGQAPYIAGSETLLVDGVAWKRVGDFLNSKSSDQHYVVEVDAFDQASILFGDGTLGAIPTAGAQASASYRIGGGAIGNVEAGSLTKLSKSYTTSAGLPVKLSVTNGAKASGGTDRETEAHGKLYGPKSLSANDRAVTRTDFETIAETVPGVARALAQTVDDNPLVDQNTTLVQIVPVGGGNPSQTLIDAVRAKLLTRKTNTSRVMVTKASYLAAAPVGTIYVVRPGPGQSPSQARLEAVGDAALAALVAFFDPLNIDIASGAFSIGFGLRIPLSKLYRTIQGMAGVSFVDLTSPAADLLPGSAIFPELRGFVKSIVQPAGILPLRVVYTWAALGTQLVVQEEP